MKQGLGKIMSEIEFCDGEDEKSQRCYIWFEFVSREKQGQQGRKELLGTLDQKAFLGALANLGCRESLALR